MRVGFGGRGWWIGAVGERERAGGRGNGKEGTEPGRGGPMAHLVVFAFFFEEVFTEDVFYRAGFGGFVDGTQVGGLVGEGEGGAGVGVADTLGAAHH